MTGTDRLGHGGATAVPGMSPERNPFCLREILVSTDAVRSRSASTSGHLLAGLGALATALAAAFVVAPRLLASWPGGGLADQRTITEALRPAFVEFWRSGDRNLPAHLQGMVAYWSRYHVIKAVTATLLLIVLVALGIQLWKALLRADSRGVRTRVALASGAGTVTALAVFSLALVMANLQGALAPLSSLLTLLEDSPPHGELVDTLDQVRQHLVDYPTSGPGRPPALDVMVSDFAWYHAVMAAIAIVLAVTFIG